MERTLAPLRFLRDRVGDYVYVRLKDKTEYVGRLVGTDSTMNLVIDECVEIRDGGKTVVARLGRVLVRGSMIMFVSFEPEKAAPHYMVGGGG